MGKLIEHIVHLLEDEILARLADGHEQAGRVVRLGLAGQVGEVIHPLLQLLHLRLDGLLLELHFVGVGDIGRRAST